MANSKWITQSGEESDCNLVIRNNNIHADNAKKEQMNISLDRVQFTDFGKELRLSLPSGQKILVFDPVLQKQIRRSKKSLLPSFLRKDKKMGGSLSVLFSILTVLLTFTAFAYLLAPQIARHVPRHWEEPLGETGFKAFAPSLCDPEVVDPIVNKLLARFNVSEELAAYLKVALVRSDTMNAIALPGGRIIFFSGLIKVMDSPEQFAAVLAHEISHQEYRHFATGMTRALMLTGLWHIVLGDLTGVLILDPITIMALMERSYSRSQELEADHGGAQYLNNAGISLQPGAQFLDKLSKKGGSIPEFLSTHPVEGRGAAFLANAGFERGELPAMLPLEWGELRKACGISDD